VPDEPGDRSDEPTAAEAGGFLPPEPPGPEPDLDIPPIPPPPPAAWPQPPPPQYQQPPPPPGWQPPPPPGWPQQPQHAQQPPAWQPQPAWQQPPPPGWQPLAPPVPGNSQAVAGFVMSVAAAALLVVSFGLSSVVSIMLAVLGIVFSSKGRKNVDEGRTPKHRDLARAGVITGIVALVLTLLATAAWVAVIVTDSG
jgi:hypothetical protein